MERKGHISRIIVITLVGLSLLGGAIPATAAEVHRLGNGINVTLHGADEIYAGLITTSDGHKTLSHPAAGTIELDSIDGSYVPYDADVVVAALDAMHGITTDVDVDVFLLPAPPAGIGSSFARRGAIYLAPGTGAIHPTTAANITTHEMGHVLTWAFMDSHPRRWAAYRDLRDLTDANFAPDAVHCDRAREILAEDIRYLFGGDLATIGGSIENHDLVLPDRIAGLAELLNGFFANRTEDRVLAVSTAFPNPCNPQTTIELVLPEGRTATGHTARLRVFDIRGSLVRTIDNGYVANGRVAVQWDGTGDDGQVVSSGRYLYVVQLGDVMARGSVTLLK